MIPALTAEAEEQLDQGGACEGQREEEFPGLFALAEERLEQLLGHLAPTHAIRIPQARRPLASLAIVPAY